HQLPALDQRGSCFDQHVGAFVRNQSSNECYPHGRRRPPFSYGGETFHRHGVFGNVDAAVVMPLQLFPRGLGPCDERGGTSASATIPRQQLVRIPYVREPLPFCALYAAKTLWPRHAAIDRTPHE